MCEAIQTLNERAAAKTKTNTLLQNVKTLMRTTGWPAGKTMDKLEISDADREVIMQLLQESIIKSAGKN
ncbi:MAG: hypothetical protein LUE14_07875 [Clostridiales bacterium]|nr:hypothetical protein [Clostridiales bacterium]